MNERFAASGRLAYRVEGTMWNVYWALPDTMEGAIPLGGIRMSFVRDTSRKHDFMELMRKSVTTLFHELDMPVRAWNTVDAPEHERGGNG